MIVSDRPMTTDVLGLTAEIVSAHIRNNKVAAEALPALIQSVYNSLSNIGTVEPEPEKRAPAVPWKKSVFPEYIVCLEDGKKLKMLKRHLNTSYGMTPDQYRAKWGLPKDYPMVAPSYATRRSDLAKKSGLGRKPAEAEAEMEAEPQVAATPEPAKRTRRTKAPAAEE